ncbi:MAG: 3-isopropylmalate dehydrogenase, partial [Planctomycetota bacterium]
MAEELDPQLQKLVDSPSYRVAFRDPDFLGREDLRPVRMQLELLKPEKAFREHGIENLVVVFGGTQVIPREEAEQQVADY